MPVVKVTVVKVTARCSRLVRSHVNHRAHEAASVDDRDGQRHQAAGHSEHHQRYATGRRSALRTRPLKRTRPAGLPETDPAREGGEAWMKYASETASQGSA